MPLISIDIDRIERRCSLYEQGAEQVAQADVLKGYKFKLIHDLGMVAAECSFLINDAFKIQRFENPAHGSTPPKVAAFLTFSIPQTLPFQNTVPIGTDNPAFHYANPALALRLACALVNHPVQKRSFEDQKRFYDIFLRNRIASIDKVMNALKSNQRAVGDAVEFELTNDEIKAIQARINMFTTLAGMPVVKQTDQ